MTFDEYPEISEEQWQKARVNDDFSYIAFEVFKHLGMSIIKLANLYENSDEHKLKAQTIEYKILQGHLMKVSRMYHSIIHLTVENKFLESIFILQRALFETLINARYLIKQKDTNLFDNYIQKSLAPERELWNIIQSNIVQRGGDIEKIEASMMNSITKTCSLAGKSITDIDPRFSSWGPTFYKKCEELGLDKLHNPIYAIGSHCIHTSFVDLVKFYLKEENGVLEIKSEHNIPQEAHMTVTGMIAVLLCQEFSVYAFSHEVAKGLSEYFKWYGETMEKINFEAIRTRHG